MPYTLSIHGCADKAFLASACSRPTAGLGTHCSLFTGAAAFAVAAAAAAQFHSSVQVYFSTYICLLLLWLFLEVLYPDSILNRKCTIRTYYVCMYVLSVRMYPWVSICMPGSQFLRGHWALTFVRFACSRASHRLPFCLAATSTICAWMPARPVSKWSVANSINGCMLGCVEKGLSGRKTEHRKSLAAPRDVATFSGGRCHILLYSICTNPVSGKARVWILCGMFFGFSSLLWLILVALVWRRET